MSQSRLKEFRDGLLDLSVYPIDQMKLQHRDMIGCTKCAAGIKPATAWSVEVLLQHSRQHASQHKLNFSEAIICYVPSNLHRVNCKLCLPPYLFRHVREAHRNETFHPIHPPSTW